MPFRGFGLDSESTGKPPEGLEEKITGSSICFLRIYMAALWLIGSVLQ